MKLFYSPASPYARKIRILIRELGLTARIDEIVADPFANDPAYLALNPLGKIPCLVLDDGESLFDSDVIALYLDSLAGRPSLFPGGEHCWHLEKLHSLGSGLLDSAVALRVEKTRPVEQQSPLWTDRHRNALSRGLQYLEAEWDGIGDAESIIHVVTACVLGYLDFRHPETGWREYCPELARWYGEFCQRPSVRDTMPA